MLFCSEADDDRPVLGAFQPPLLAAAQAESSDDDVETTEGCTRVPQPPTTLAALSTAVEPEEVRLLPSAEDALEDNEAGAFLKVCHSVDVPAMKGFEDPSEVVASKPSGAERQLMYTENAAACLAARNQAPSANRKRKSGSEPVDGGHFRSEAYARKNAGKARSMLKAPVLVASQRATLAPG